MCSSDLTLKAALQNPVAGDTKVSEIVKFTSANNYSTVVVSGQTADTTKWTTDVKAVQGQTTITVTGLKDAEATLTDYNKEIPVVANGVGTTTVTVTVKNAKGNPVSNYPVTLSTNSANIELNKTSVTTNYRGRFQRVSLGSCSPCGMSS